MDFNKFARRTVYLGYYVYQMDWLKFYSYVRYVQEKCHRSAHSLLSDVVVSVYRYNIGLIDYFYFGFYDKSAEERSRWVGTGYKYEYDLVMNPRTERNILWNKLLFFDAFAPFINHAMCTLEDAEMRNEVARRVFENPSGKIAVKDSLGQCGKNVHVMTLEELSTEEVVAHMKRQGFDMVEEFIVQHPSLRRLSDSGLNTVRIVTQVDDSGRVSFLGPTLRITINSSVDNMAMGNIAAPICINSGLISGPGVYQDIKKTPEPRHPVTGVELVGFPIPYWNEVLYLCRDAAMHNRRNRSIGWDVAISESGPSLLEGNHNWCKLLWQLPIGRGLKADLDKYLENNCESN